MNKNAILLGNIKNISPKQNLISLILYGSYIFIWKKSEKENLFFHKNPYHA
jgi:hypothetical protein